MDLGTVFALRSEQYVCKFYFTQCRCMEIEDFTCIMHGARVGDQVPYQYWYCSVVLIYTVDSH